LSEEDSAQSFRKVIKKICEDDDNFTIKFHAAVDTISKLIKSCMNQIGIKQLVFIIIHSYYPIILCSELLFILLLYSTFFRIIYIGENKSWNHNSGLDRSKIIY